MPPRSPATAAAAVLALLAPPLVVLVFPAVALVARNSEYFPAGYATAWPLYGAAAVLLAAGTAVLATARGPAGRLLAALYLLSAPAWFVHALALSATRSLAATALVAAAWLVAAVAGSRVPRRTLVRYCGVAAAAVLVGAGLPAAGAALAARSQPAADPMGRPVGGDKRLPNVYHLVFDEYQSDVFAHLLDDDLRRELRGFAFFPDASATFGRTEMSLASTFATADYGYDVPPEEQVARAFTAPGAPLRVLGDLGYHRGGYLHRTRYFGPDPPLDDWVLHDDLAAGPAPGQADLLTSLWLYAHAPEAASRRLLPERHYEQLTADALLPDDAPPRSVASLRALIARERALPARGRYVLGHFVLPHFPNVLAPDCAYVPGETTGPVEQAACTNRLLVEFLSTLRDLNRLDDAVVIVQGDHGSWYDFSRGRPRSVRGDGLYSDEASTARSRALLLVHLPGGALGRPDELEVVEGPATVDDVLPTLFAQLGVEHPFAGNRLRLQAGLPGARERFYHFYDKGEGRIAGGPLVRYRIEGGRALRERKITVPAP